MIIDHEFIWNQDHFVYHITEKNNIESIITKGLIPSLGERSLTVGDNFKAIYFFDVIYSVEEWMNFLYKNKDKDSLEVLRFNIKKIKWYTHREDEFYIKRTIPVDMLEYLELYKNNDIIHFNDISKEDIYNLDYRFNKLKEYNKKRNT